MNLIEFIDSEEMTPGSFEGESWDTWRAILSAAFALPMTDDQQALFKRLAGGRELPSERVRELFVVAGRRSAKTHVTGAIAVYLSTIGAHLDGLLDRLSPGERGVVAVLAVDRHQAKVALNYIVGMVEASPVLRKLVTRTNTEGLELGRIAIEVHTNSFRSVRGRTLLAAILDECAFYRSDSSMNPDIETYRAIVPSLATTGGMLIGVSSPYSKRGLLYNKHRKHYGQPGDILVVQGATSDFNPTIEPQIIADAMEDDPDAAMAEWMGQFRNDVEQFINRDQVTRLMRSEPLELPPWDKHKYFAFIDPSGGGADGFAIAIGHREKNLIVVDLLRERIRVPPAQVVEEFSHLLRMYSISEVLGDRYAGQWVAGEFRRHHIHYRYADKNRSELYLEILSTVNNGSIQLPPIDKLANQFASLERRTGSSGKDIIDHPPGMHDDLANAVAGLASAIEVGSRVFKVPFTWQ